MMMNSKCPVKMIDASQTQRYSYNVQPTAATKILNNCNYSDIFHAIVFIYLSNISLFMNKYSQKLEPFDQNKGKKNRAKL